MSIFQLSQELFMQQFSLSLSCTVQCKIPAERSTLVTESEAAFLDALASLRPILDSQTWIAVYTWIPSRLLFHIASIVSNWLNGVNIANIVNMVNMVNAYMEKGGDTGDYVPANFLDFPPNFRLRTRF